jgi:glycerol-3-phosphate acyltransferase PlsY
MTEIGFAVLAYLIGSISFAVLASRIFRLPDPRSYGSKNPGATNVLRSGSKAAALLTLLGDCAKGYVAVELAQRYGPQFGGEETAIAASALGVFAGHLFPLFLRLRGGKGVATALGVLLALNVWLGIGVATVWLAVFSFMRISSLAALAAAPCAIILSIWVMDWNAVSAAVLVIALVLVWRHRSNIRNLLAGSEGKFGRPHGPVT